MNTNENAIAIRTLDQKHERCSEKYQVIPTKEIAQKFQDMGFKVDDYKAVRVRDENRRGYQKHFVRLSHPMLLSSKHTDLKIQLLVTNSHDRSSSFKLQLGVFRMVCSNGLVAGTVFETISIRHTRKSLIEIEPAIERMVAQIEKLDSAIERMKNKVLTAGEAKALYEKAVGLRYGDNVKSVDVSARREEDRAEDLFTVYNRIQEALIRGSDTTKLSPNGNEKVRKSRPITNIDKERKINEKLFDLAYDMVA